MKPAKRVSAVLVTFNSAGVIRQALHSLPDGVEAIVVDNASQDTTAEDVKWLGVSYLQSATNIGFGRACNLGASHATREFLLFLNPDARLESGALEALVYAADGDKKCAVFSPRIMRADGSHFFRTRSHLLPASKRIKRQVPTEDRDIEILSGAAFLCRRAAFEQVAGFDPHIFMYCEDDDLGLRLCAAGWRMRYVHNAVVVHQGNQSSAPTEDLDWTKSYHEMRSRWYTAQKHGVRFSRIGQGLQVASRWLGAVARFDHKARRRHQASLCALWDEPSC